MTISTTLASWLVGAAVMAFSAALSVSPNPDPDPADTSFEAPRAVVLRGYGGDAMEPFVTRDGRWLLFNTRNGPRDQFHSPIRQENSSRSRTRCGFV